jgi:pyruvate/2-oxoglutarate dehydrogenase complex dihydrolipoamide acyltransferase (E2) component
VIRGLQPELRQRGVDAVLGVEEVAPHRAVDDRRQRPRQHHDRSEQPAGAQRRVEQQRDRDAEHELKSGRHHREVRGALDRRPELALAQRERVVAQPDPGKRAREWRVDCEERRVDGPQDRIDDDPEDDDDAGREQREREAALARARAPTRVPLTRTGTPAVSADAPLVISDERRSLRRARGELRRRVVQRSLRALLAEQGVLNLDLERLRRRVVVGHLRPQDHVGKLGLGDRDEL